MPTNSNMQALHHEQPLVSVAIPTYRRPDLLRETIDSIRRQTYPHWELIISDDEEGEGESWRFVQALHMEDPRIRIVKNPGRRGQAGNTNNAVHHCRGKWVKLLHDDDRLKPECLEELVRIAETQEGVACIVCGVEKYAHGQRRHSVIRSGWPRLERIPKDQFHLAMYMNEHTGGALPSQRFIRRDILAEEGVSMQPYPGIERMLDSPYSAQIARHGDWIIYSKPLVEWHQGDHEAETGKLSPEAREQEWFALRRLLWELIPDKRRVPPVDAVMRMLFLHRSFWRIFKRRDLRGGLRMFFRNARPGSLLLLVRWYLHVLTRGQISWAQRQILEK